MLEPTPTDSGLPRRLGNFKTLIEALDYAALGESGINFYSATGVLETVLPYRQLQHEAEELGKKLLPLAPKDGLFGLIAETSPHFIRAFFACQYAGLVPVPMPMPTTMGGKDAYLAQIEQMARTAKMEAVMVPERLVDMLAETFDMAGIKLVNMTAPDLSESNISLRGRSRTDLCYIQYSSGSTSDPKGVIGTQATVTANCHAIIAHGLKVTEGDRAISWLPMYHDMGLIGFMIAPMMSQLSLDLLEPAAFARRPLTWLELISRNKGTLSYSPSFGYELCVKRWRDDKTFDLSSWRAAGIGGDMVRPDALGVFGAVFGDHGFDPKAFVPSYGMAEATLAIAFAPLGKGAEPDVIDKNRLGRTGDAIPASDITAQSSKRVFMLCGTVVPEHDLEVRGSNGAPLPDRKVGSICVRGPSITPGYYLNEHATKAAFTDDGWLQTGDLGYMLDGQIVITGRSKDLILANGRNIWPQDLEWAVEGGVSIKIGRTAAFAIEDTEGKDEIVLLVECRSRAPESLRKVQTEVAQLARVAANATVQVCLVPLSSLVVTSSGKISRARAKQKFLKGAFENLNTLVLAETPFPRAADVS